MSNIEKNNEIFLQRYLRNDIFLIDGVSGEEIGFKKFINISISLSRFFLKVIAKSSQSEKKIAVCLDNSVHFLYCYMAAFFSGIIIIPIDPLKPHTEIQEILDDSFCFYIVSNQELKFVNIHSIQIPSDSILSISLDEPTVYNIITNLQVDVPFSITYTSGSTGKPKGVVHSFKNLCMAANALCSSLSVTKNDVVYHNLPMAYMAGLLNLFIVPLVAEAKIVIGPRFSAQDINSFWDIPLRYNVSVFCLIPTEINLLNRLDRNLERIHEIRSRDFKVFVATAPLDLKQSQIFSSKYDIELLESYGLSETLFVSCNLAGENLKGVGKLLDGVKVVFGDDNEIIINSPWNFLGYFNANNFESKQCIDFFSGDMGILNDEQLSITGRIKNIIIRGGVNISPARLEAVISSIVDFHEFVVLGLPDKIIGEKAVLCYVANCELTKEMKNEVNAIVKKQLGNDYRIDQFEKLVELKKNINGKFDIRAIREMI